MMKSCLISILVSLVSFTAAWGQASDRNRLDPNTPEQQSESGISQRGSFRHLKADT